MAGGVVSFGRFITTIGERPDFSKDPESGAVVRVPMLGIAVHPDVVDGHQVVLRNLGKVFPGVMRPAENRKRMSHDAGVSRWGRLKSPPPFP